MAFLTYLSALLFASQVFSQENVKVTTFFETLCPDSQRFMRNQLEPTYREIGDIMDVETYAYGIATETPSGDGYTFECQHGPDECTANMILACADNYIANHEQFLNYTFCMMDRDDPYASGQICADQTGVDYSSIEACANSTEGQILLHNIGLIQAEQASDLYWVPWIIINDEFTDENLEAAQEDLKSLVCSTYTGEQPPACSTTKKLPNYI